jgi:hypothetical protein
VRVYQRGIGGFYAKCLFDTQLRALFLANFRSIRKRHSYRGWIVILIAAIDFCLRAMLSKSPKGLIVCTLKELHPWM